MRKYSSIWKILKFKKECAIAAPPELHLRIIKGLINEKYRDLGFKLMLSEEDKSAKITYVREGAKITFKLTVYGVCMMDL